MIIVHDIPRTVALRWDTDRGRFMVLQPLSATVERRGVPFGSWCKTWTVPRGFDTDLASIPRLLLSTTGGKVGRHLIAAVLHDYLYRTGFASREVADQVFLEAMKELGVRPTLQQMFYWAVRIGGGSSYLA